MRAKRKPMHKTIPTNLMILIVFSEHWMQILFIFEYLAPSTLAQMEHKGPVSRLSQEEFRPPLLYFKE